MSKALRIYYETEKELENEYYENNKQSIDQIKNSYMSKVYKTIVNPYMFSLFEGLSLLFVTKTTFGSFKNINRNKFSLYIGKVLLCSIINLNVFYFKSNTVSKLINEKKKKNTLNIVFNSFLNPIFLIQKDKFIIQTISLFKRKKNNPIIIKKDTQPVTIQPRIKEGFL